MCRFFFVYPAIFVIYVKASIDDESFLQNPKFLDHREITADLLYLEATYAGLARLYSIGKSVEGRELWVLNIRKNVLTPRPLLMPMVKYIGNIHGDEILGRQLLMYLAHYLLSNYQTNEEIRYLLDTTDIHLLPSMNPDGFERGPKYQCSLVEVSNGRSNAHEVDLNRNFPNLVTSPNLDFHLREPEVLAVMQWVLSNSFVLSANFHGGAVVASYAYDNKRNGSSVTSDEDVFQHVSRIYAKNHRTMSMPVQCFPHDHVFEDGIINGAKWYDLKGGMQDFNYDYSNCFEITIELSCCKGPNATTLSEEWLNNKQSFIKYIKQAHMGMKGLVADLKGIPINAAQVVVQGRSKLIITSLNGEYWRLLLPGTYVVSARAEGYDESQSINVTIVKNQLEVVNFMLKKHNSTF